MQTKTIHLALTVKADQTLTEARIKKLLRKIIDVGFADAQQTYDDNVRGDENDPHCEISQDTLDALKIEVTKLDVISGGE